MIIYCDDTCVFIEVFIIITIDYNTYRADPVNSKAFVAKLLL